MEREFPRAIGRLKSDPTLTVLDLRGNVGGPEGARQLGEALKENKTLAALYLDLNDFGTQGAWALVGALKGNKTLVGVSFSASWIRGEDEADRRVAGALAEALRDNPNLVYVSGIDRFKDGLKETCEHNTQAAESLLEIVQGDEALTDGDFEALKLRLPAMRILASKKLGEKPAVELLERVSDMLAGYAATPKRTLLNKSAALEKQFQVGNSRYVMS